MSGGGGRAGGCQVLVMTDTRCEDSQPPEMSQIRGRVIRYYPNLYVFDPGGSRKAGVTLG